MKAQGRTGKHRELHESTRKDSKAQEGQGSTGKDRVAQGRTVKHREDRKVHGMTRKHREGQGSTG